MLKKIKTLFFQKNIDLEQQFLVENNIKRDLEFGYIVDGIVVNQLSERLKYLSNRKIEKFDDLEKLYLNTMIINEKIDLEIANKKFNSALGNTEENLLEFKKIIEKLNKYYRNFLR